MENKKKAHMVRIDDETFNVLKDIALNEGRTISNLIRFILNTHVKANRK
jgi:predicted DNA-binding protein